MEKEENENLKNKNEDTHTEFPLQKPPRPPHPLTSMRLSHSSSSRVRSPARCISSILPVKRAYSSHN